MSDWTRHGPVPTLLYTRSKLVSTFTPLQTSLCLFDTTFPLPFFSSLNCIVENCSLKRSPIIVSYTSGSTSKPPFSFHMHKLKPPMMPSKKVLGPRPISKLESCMQPENMTTPNINCTITHINGNNYFLKQPKLYIIEISQSCQTSVKRKMVFQ